MRNIVVSRTPACLGGFLLLTLLFGPSAGAADWVLPQIVASMVGFQADTDVPYVTGGECPQELDICYPIRGKARPLIVWIHGGGWQSGSKKQNPALFLLRDGYAVASINYRLSGQAPWPAQIEDCKAAIRYLRANASRYNIDPDRIGVWGGSAGGHLAAMLGTAGDAREFEIGDRLSESSRVQAVCDWFGPSRFEPADYESESEERRLSIGSMVTALLGGPLETNAEAARSASPLTYVSEDDPPFLIMHGENDTLVPLAQSELLLQSLKDAGVTARLRVLKDAGHAGREWLDTDVLKQVRSFFDKTLKS